MNRRGFFGALAALGAAIGLGKVAGAVPRSEAVKSPPAAETTWYAAGDEIQLTPFPYEWKNLHAPVTFTMNMETKTAVELIEEKMESRTASLERMLNLVTRND